MAYLQLENLSFSYSILEGKKKVFSHLSFSFPSSGLVCIIGESGCGKSTLLHLIGGYLIPDEGEIKTDFDILDTGIVFQSLYLIEHLNLQDNVALGLVLKGEKRENACKISEEILTKLGLEGYLNSDVNKLSGGQKARGNIARTLSNKTSLLLLDEPTGSLDETNSREIFDLLKQIGKSNLVIVVTHNKDLALEKSDCVYSLENDNFVCLKKLNCQEIEVKSKSEKKTIRIDESLFLCWSFLKSRGKKFLASISFLCLALAFLMLAFNGISNADGAIQSIEQTCFNYEVFTIQEKKKYEFDDQDMVLYKLVKLSEEKEEVIASKFPEIKFYPCLDSILLPQFYPKVNGEYLSDAAFLSPSFNFNKPLVSGREPSRYNEVIVNTDFNDLLNGSSSFRLEIEKEILTSAYGSSVSDLLEISINFKVVGVCKENELFSRPSVYYSYSLIKDYLDRIELPNASGMLGYPIDIKQRLELFSSQDDDLTSFKTIGTYFYPHDVKEYVDSLSDVFSFSSYPLDLGSSFTTLIESMGKLAFLFLVLACVCSLFLEMVLIEHTYRDKRKELAIYLSFHLDFKAFFKTCSGQITIQIFAVVLLSLAVYPVLAFLGNSLFSSFSFPSLFYLLPDAISVLALIVLSVVFAFVSNFYPMWKMYFKGNLIDLLKGE